MPDIFLSVEITGEEFWERKLATVGQAISDFSPMWDDLRGWFIQVEREQFQTEGHGRWPQLAESTVKRRSSSHPILHVTGALEASLTGGAGFVEEKTESSVTFGTSLRVGKWNLGTLHQTGTGVGARVSRARKQLKAAGVKPKFRERLGDYRMPPRPPIQISFQELSSFRTKFSTYIHQRITQGE